MIEQTIGTVVLSIGGWIAGQKFLLPHLVKGWNWIRGRKKEFDDQNVDASKNILDIKLQNQEVYESQITFLMNQIDRLEHEINNHQEQLGKMRSMVLELNSRLFKKDILIGKLRELCCANADCKFRVMCTDDNCSNLSMDHLVDQN